MTRDAVFRGPGGIEMINRIALAMLVLGLAACGPKTADQQPATGGQAQAGAVASASPALCPRSATVRPDEIETRFLSALAAPILGFAAEKIFDVLMATATTGAEVAAEGASQLAGVATTPSEEIAADCIPEPTEALQQDQQAALQPVAAKPVSATMAVATYLDDGGAVLRQVDPAEVTFKPADRIILRTTANLPGIHRLSNRTPDGRLVPLGDWPAAAGEVHDIGPFQFAGQAGTDQVVFRFLPCSDPGTSAEDRIEVSAAVMLALPTCRDAQLSGRSSQPAPRDMFIADKGKNHYASAPLDDLIKAQQLQRPLTTEISFTHNPGQG